MESRRTFKLVVNEEAIYRLVSERRLSIYDFKCVNSEDKERIQLIYLKSLKNELDSDKEID